MSEFRECGVSSTTGSNNSYNFFSPRKHHELASAILELIGALPGFPIVTNLGRPPLFNQETDILVRKGILRERPWAPIPTAIGVTTAEGVSPEEGHDLLVRKTHAFEICVRNEINERGNK